MPNPQPTSRLRKAVQCCSITSAAGGSGSLLTDGIWFGAECDGLPCVEPRPVICLIRAKLRTAQRADKREEVDRGDILGCRGTDMRKNGMAQLRFSGDPILLSR